MLYSPNIVAALSLAPTAFPQTETEFAGCRKEEITSPVVLTGMKVGSGNLKIDFEVP